MNMLLGIKDIVPLLKATQHPLACVYHCDIIISERHKHEKLLLFFHVLFFLRPSDESENEWVKQHPHLLWEPFAQRIFCIKRESVLVCDGLEGREKGKMQHI